MYCPKCGITIGEIGNFCARCGKDVAYLREENAAPETFPANPAGYDSDQVDAALTDSDQEIAAASLQSAKPEKKHEQQVKTAAMFYCSYCGTMVFGTDNFCYQCSKVLQKKYYSQATKKRKFKLVIILSIIFVVSQTRQ